MEEANVAELEAGNGVEFGIGNGVLQKDPVAYELGSNLNKENEVIDNGTDALQVNGVTEDPSNAEGLSSSVVEGEVVDPAASDVKASVLPKKTGSSKVKKDGGGRSGSASVSKTQRAGLSQSLSFPFRGAALAGGLRKSAAFGKQTKADAKQPQPNEPELASFVTNGRPTGRQNIHLAAAASTKRSLPVMSGLVDNGTSEAMKSKDGNIKPLRRSLPVKSDDDANSTTSSTTPSAANQRKSTGSFFSFRLDERAEKRKEFFTKLEEKILAKEAEKTNLQEKSKESQEAEIRQLRKSLTFKAAPMPTFYREPGPPKAELKKIPPTRARSPKLGRHKPSTITVNNPSEGSVSSQSTNTIKSNGGGANANGVSVALKKTTQKTLSKLPSQKSAAAAKPDPKPLSLKPKVSNLKHKVDKAKEVENNNNGPTTETFARVEPDPSEKTAEGNEAILNSSDPEVAPGDVISISIEAPSEKVVEGNEVVLNSSDPGVTLGDVSEVPIKA